MGMFDWFFGKNRLRPAIAPSDMVAALTQRLSDTDSLRRMDAVTELAGSSDPRAATALVQVYENEKEMGGIREAALDGIWRTKPDWLPTISGVEIVQGCVTELVSLYDRSRNGEGFITHSTASKPARDIGQTLHEAGGFQLMVLAHRRFRQQRPRASRNLEHVWDGVGSWQG